MDRNLGIDAGLALLRKAAPSEELEYGFVVDCLKEYHSPRVKINHLLKIGGLIRVKKGIYVFGPNFAKKPYSLEVLANMIYGPSYISLEWACQYYRLIPERVRVITSVTNQRTTQFQTPVGRFTYDHLQNDAYANGATIVTISDTQHALIASKEKALIDLLVVRRGKFRSKKQFKETLFEDLRVEEQDLATFDLKLLNDFYQARPHSAIEYLMSLLQN